MINTIRIFPDRCLMADSNKIGIMGEVNAEILHFVHPAEINGEGIENFDCELVFQNEYNGEPARYVYSLEGTDFKIPVELTTSPELVLMVQYLKGSQVKWKSCPTTFYLADSINDDINNPLDSLRDELRAEEKAEITNVLRKSFTYNIGGDFSNASFEDMIGVARESDDGIIDDEGNFEHTIIYDSGELNNLRKALSNLFQTLSETITTGEEVTAKEAISGINTAWTNLKTEVVSTINNILGTDYSNNISWEDINRLIQTLPSDVANIVTSSIDDNSDSLREDVDNKIAELCNQYDVDIDILTGSWFATLESISALCEAIDTGGGEITADNISVPFSYTENGVTTNLEFTVIDGNPVIRMEE
ncbi:MAG: hypothetical protein MJ168_05385 [Clostridia bacterium]|nr:hypothetical protein [Clostridia bacterium]